MKELDMLVRVDNRRRPADQVAKALQLSTKLGFDFVSTNPSGECPPHKGAQWPQTAVRSDQAWNLPRRQDRRVHGQARMPADFQTRSGLMPGADGFFGIRRVDQQNGPGHQALSGQVEDASG